MTSTSALPPAAGFMGVLGTHAYTLAAASRCHSLQDGRHQWPQRFEPIGACHQRNEPDRRGNLVSLREPLINGDEGLVRLRGEPEEFAVLDPGPTDLRYSVNLVTCQLGRQAAGKALIK